MNPKSRLSAKKTCKYFTYQPGTEIVKNKSHVFWLVKTDHLIYGECLVHKSERSSVGIIALEKSVA